MTSNFKTTLALTTAILVTACGKEPPPLMSLPPVKELPKVVMQPASPEPAAPAPVMGAQVNPGTPLSAYKPLTSGDQLMAHYLALVGVPEDASSLAIYDGEYQRAQGDFARRDRLAKYRAELVTAAAQAKAAPYVVFDLPEFAAIGRGALGAYNFEKKAFQLRFFAKEVVPQGGRFAPSPGARQANSASSSSQDYGPGLKFGGNDYSSLYFSNWRDFEYLTIPDEAKARDLDGKKNQYRISDRKGVLGIRAYVFINAPLQADSFSVAANSVQAQIMKIQLVDFEGKVLAEK